MNKNKQQIDFGISIRIQRNKKKLTQEDLAGLCGLDRTYIGSVERGERNVSLLNIHKIASALEINIKELF